MALKSRCKGVAGSLSLSLSVCLSACLPVCLSACLSVCVCVCVPLCLSVSLSLCLSVSLSLCLSVSLSLSLCLSLSLSVSISLFLSVCCSGQKNGLFWPEQPVTQAEAVILQHIRATKKCGMEPCPWFLIEDVSHYRGHAHGPFQL